MGLISQLKDNKENCVRISQIPGVLWLQPEASLAGLGLQAAEGPALDEDTQALVFNVTDEEIVLEEGFVSCRHGEQLARGCVSFGREADNGRKVGSAQCIDDPFGSFLNMLKAGFPVST